MIRKRNLLIGVVVALFMLSHGAWAQKGKREYSGFFDSYYYRGPVAFTLGVGPSLYSGDYAKGFYGNKIGFSISGGANYKVWPRCVYGAQIRYTTLGSSYSDTTGSYSYSGSHTALDLYGRFYLREDIVRKSNDRNKFRKGKFYVIYGVSILKYSRFGFSFPLGLAYSYEFNTRLSLHGSFTHHFMISDKLDGLSSGGPDGYALINATIQYSPWGKKPKKKMKDTPPEANPNREEHQEWRKEKKKPKPVEEEYPLPGENEETPEGENPEGTEGTEEKPAEDQPTEEKPAEETPEETK